MNTSDTNGLWSDNTATAEFTVLPAFYQTNWFRALCATVFLALLWAAYQLRVRQLHKQFAMTLEARVGERTRIARDLHDTLLQSFHGLLLRFQTVSQLLPERPVEAKEKLEARSSRPPTRSPKAGMRCRDCAIPQCKATISRWPSAPSEKNSQLTQPTTDLRSVWRLKASREICTPSFVTRSTRLLPRRCGTRFATLGHGRSRLKSVMTLSNSDYGCGTMEKVLIQRFSPAKVVRDTSACPGCGNAPTLIGGKLVVWSEVDAGTEVELRVPASTAYATAQRHSWFSRKAKA